LSSDLNGVPSWARDEILKLQPFSEGEFTKELAMLHELARRDRHRAVLLQIGVPFVHGVTVQLQEDATTPVTFRGFDSIEWPLGVDAHPEITVVLCLNERGYGNAAIVPTSFHLLEVVRQVVDRIESARPR
jgi:hypothetical protein